MYHYRSIIIFFKHITVEPSLLLFMIVHEFMTAFDNNLFLQKSCRFNQTTEPDLNTPCDDEKRGVLFMSEVAFKYLTINILLCILVTIFATSWSDEAGRRRRPLIYLPIFGQIFHTLSSCLHSYFWQWSPTFAVLCWMVVESISGGVILLVSAVQVYVSDICGTENLTMRLGILVAIKSISSTFGKGASGHILRTFGFFYSYLICFTLSASGVVLGFILIRDTSVSVEKKIGFCHVFNLKHLLLDSFKVVFNKNLGRKRIIVSSLMVANLLILFTFLGELSLFYSYLRYRFGWNEANYSDFMFYKFSGSILGTIFSSIFLSKWLQIHDGLIGMLAGTFDTIAMVVLLLATQIWQLYCIPLIDIFHGTVFSVVTSFMSKYYDVGELGRLYAFNGILSLLIPFSYPAYNGIFQTTIDSFPSAFCFLSIVLDVVIVLCFCVAYYLSKKIGKDKSAVQDAPEDKQVQLQSTNLGENTS